MRKQFIVALALLATTGAFGQRRRGSDPFGVAPGAAVGIGGRPVYGGTPIASGVGRPIYGSANGGTYGSGINSLPPGTVYDMTTGAIRPMSMQEERMIRAMERQRNLARQHSMVEDTNRLAALAATVHQDVINAEGKLSSDAIKRVGEVEKLAKSVQRKMSGQE
jgi:hypothetical protein